MVSRRVAHARAVGPWVLEQLAAWRMHVQCPRPGTGAVWVLLGLRGCLRGVQEAARSLGWGAEEAAMQRAVAVLWRLAGMWAAVAGAGVAHEEWRC
jgi:hypothetical protein